MANTGIATENFILRQAQAKDCVAIRSVAQITWEATYAESVLKTNRTRMIATSYSDFALQRAFRREGHDNWFWVAESCPDQKIIGFAEVSIRSQSPHEAELTRIYVLPDWQRQGLGRSLVESLTAELKAMPGPLRPPRLFLAVAAHNQSAIAFYEQRGFQHKRDFEANLPGQVLAMREYVLSIDNNG